MKYDLARLELQRILKEQQTVSTDKLRVLLNSMNVSLNKSRGILEEQERRKYERVIGDLRRENEKLRKRIKRMMEDIFEGDGR